QSSKFELTLSLSEDEQGRLAGQLDFNLDLYDAATARRLLGHYVALLSGAAQAPGAPLAELPLLTAAERRQLAEWNDTGETFAEAPEVSGWPGGLHRLIAAQAARTPDLPAVADEARTLTYAELLRASGRLAARLRRLGAGPGEVVGVCAERSADLAVA